MRHLLFILTTDNGTVGEGVGCDCGSRERRQLVIIVMMMAEVMSIPTTVSWDQRPPPHCQAIIRHSRHLPLQDVAIIHNMTTSI